MNHTRALGVLDEKQMEVYARQDANDAGKVTRIQEEADLAALVRVLCGYTAEKERYGFFDGFYFGYCIPRIGKEFDLLRFGKNLCLNIEIKNHSTKETIRRQLLRNRYYLSALNRPLELYTFIAEDASLYTLKDRELVKGEWEKLAETVRTMEWTEEEDPDALFAPERFLISPVYTPNRFLSGEYFLTTHQEAIRAGILELKEDLYCIEGRSGTGKTLLLYDIYRQLIRRGILTQKEICIIQCAGMHYGHGILLRNGIRIRELSEAQDLPSDPDIRILLFDEAQYIPEDMMHALLKQIRASGKKAVFASDPLWTSYDERAAESIAVLTEQYGAEVHRLTAKIRTNRETAAFTECMFDLSRKKASPAGNRVHLACTDSAEESAQLTATLRRKGYLRVSGRDTLFQGFFEEEAEKAVILLDHTFGYDARGRLVTSEGEAVIRKLQRRVCRVRSDLYVIVQGNPDLFAVLVSLFA